MTPLRASFLMTLSMAAFAGEDALVKYLSATLPVGQVVIAIGLVGVLVYGTLAHVQGVPVVSKIALRGPVLVRNLGEVFGAASFVAAIALAPLSIVITILQAMPLAVTLGAAAFLGERVGLRRWSAIAVGFLGVLLVLRPWGEAFEPAALLAVISVAFLAARDLATRRVPAGLHLWQLSSWGFLALLPAGVLLFVLMRQAPMIPDPQELSLTLAASLCGILGYAALVLATRYADIASTVPFRYTRLLFGMLIGMVVFGEQPDLLTWAGAGLIVAAGLYTFARERRLARLSSLHALQALSPQTKSLAPKPGNGR